MADDINIDKETFNLIFGGNGDPRKVNPKITDAVTQANVKVLADSPAQALSTLYQTMAHSTGLSMQNSVANQQNMATIDTAVTTQGVNLLYTLDTATDARSTVDILTGNELASQLAQLSAAIAGMKQVNVKV